MRLFLLNKSKGFKVAEIAKRSRVSPETVRRELKQLAAASFAKKKSEDWHFNPIFKYSREIEDLLINTDTIDTEGIVNTFKSSGKIKLVLVSGIFMKNKDSRIDLLVVGDQMKKGKIEESIRKLEAEIGAELVYAIFETKEFLYRLNMYDKLVRDILDFPHEVLIQGKELSTQTLKKA